MSVAWLAACMTGFWLASRLAAWLAGWPAALGCYRSEGNLRGGGKFVKGSRELERDIRAAREVFRGALEVMGAT